MSAVFADTFFFVAGLNPSDQAHASALAFSAKHKDSIVTTVWVLTEVANIFRKKPQRQGVVRFLRELPSDPRIRIIPASQAHYERGMELYSQRLDKDWSLTDCISFVVMREENLKEALTGNRHFEQAGFVALLK